ncbi:MAG: ABC transporter substrate-binding protein [Paracoccus sp. (in: a-proteobacteria)]|uniref:ABC transporter substrate-binding protein n=1 Tax=Paracoccus sp. TaxID=267 RepID=UPI0026DF187B|nr:ABC transporter substrate-binding protein [Paracoccus sp. (in: a-proteobacteria)]MDO5612488.1 ABC transporter substrate-binding protein [Paracoccus sp. (in: a-proteobacteria)]
MMTISARMAASTAVALALTLGAAQAETLRWARSADALTMDPHAQNEGPTLTLLHNVYETLLGRDVDGTLTPRLATEWSVDPEDPSIWVFKLREGVKFHDGADFTAEDVVFSLNRAKAETSDFKALHAAVESVEADGDYTVRIRMNGPAPIYPQNLTNTFMVDQGWTEANNVVAPQNFAAGEDNFAVRNTNGTGPYRLVSRDPEVRTVLAHFDGHWDETPAVTEIVYTPIKEAATRVAALLSGEIDFVQDVPVQDIQRLEQTDSVTVTTGPENRSIYFSYDMGSDKLRSGDTTENPFKKPEVREAFWLALDRDAIRQVVMRGQSDPSGVAVPPFANGWTEELNAYAAPDYDRAKQLLADAGYPNGFSLDLHCPNDRYLNDEAICQAYVGMLGRIGVRANLVAQNRSLHFPVVQNGEADFFMMGWGVPPFDSQYVFDFLIHSKTDQLGGWNASNYSDADVDAKIDSLSSDVDEAHRNNTINEIWNKVQEDRVLLNVHNQVLAYATRKGVNIAVHPENQPRIPAVSFD